MRKFIATTAACMCMAGTVAPAALATGSNPPPPPPSSCKGKPTGATVTIKVTINLGGLLGTITKLIPCTCS